MINLNNLGAKQVAVVGTIANDLKNLNNNTANLITMESENQVDYADNVVDEIREKKKPSSLRKGTPNAEITGW